MPPAAKSHSLSRRRPRITRVPSAPTGWTILYLFVALTIPVAAAIYIAGSAVPQFDSPNNMPPVPLTGLPGDVDTMTVMATTPPPPKYTKWHYFFAPTSAPFNGRANWPHLHVYRLNPANGVPELLTAGPPRRGNVTLVPPGRVIRSLAWVGQTRGHPRPAGAP